mgnify:CR=1 FL=1
MTGVSGGGKSSLILETLFKGLNKELNGSREQTGVYDKIIGLENIDKIIDIDQSPIGRTPRSNPATYTGLFTYIRDWFAGLPEAKARGYSAGRFSLTLPAAAAKPAKETALPKSKCTFCPMFTLPATSAKANASIAKRWKSNIRANPSPTFWT